MSRVWEASSENTSAPMRVQLLQMPCEYHSRICAIQSSKPLRFRRYEYLNVSSSYASQGKILKLLGTGRSTAEGTEYAKCIGSSKISLTSFSILTLVSWSVEKGSARFRRTICMAAPRGIKWLQPAVITRLGLRTNTSSFGLERHARTRGATWISVPLYPSTMSFVMFVSSQVAAVRTCPTLKLTSFLCRPMAEVSW